MVLKLYNTLHRRVEVFEPVTAGQVRMYHCGPTVYSSPHIGNFRSFLMADLLGRHLRMRGYKVTQVMNITDVGHLTEDDIEEGEDKMMASARREKLDPFELARKYEAEFMDAARVLGFDMENYSFPRATEHIDEMLEIIKGLLDSGFAYEVNGSVYFDHKRFKGYGSLSGKKLDELLEGARVAVNPDKRDPKDFALWKVDKAHLMQWDAPWGRGFPGWHIECSAMSRKYLGDCFDVHTGGEDNLFPHHECERAQSEAFTGKAPFVRYWMHCRHLLVDNEKMAKSAGNFYTLADLLKKEDGGEDPRVGEGYSGQELRYALSSVHYRKPMNFTLDVLADARNALDRIRQCRARLVRIQAGMEEAGKDEIDGVLELCEEDFGLALDADLNVSEALAALFKLVAELNRLIPDLGAAGRALALFKKLATWCGLIGEEPVVAKDAGSTVLWGGLPDDPMRAEISALAEEREKARKAKDFARSDALRDEIVGKGYRLVDSPMGPRVELPA